MINAATRIMAMAAPNGGTARVSLEGSGYARVLAALELQLAAGWW